MSIEYLKLFFVLVDPEGRIFEMQMGDTWDPVQKREGGWSLGQLLDEDGSVYTRSEWPGGAIAVIQPGKLSDNLLFAKGGLGKHPGHDGWREIVVQAHTFFEAANTIVQFLQWEKDRQQVAPCRGENWQYSPDDPHAWCTEDWCLQNKSTWAEGYQQEKYDPTNREQVRRAFLQAQLELKEQTEASSYMGTRGALMSLQRIKKHWDAVK